MPRSTRVNCRASGLGIFIFFHERLQSTSQVLQMEPSTVTEKGFLVLLSRRSSGVLEV